MHTLSGLVVVVVVVEERSLGLVLGVCPGVTLEDWGGLGLGGAQLTRQIRVVIRVQKESRRGVLRQVDIPRFKG